MRLTLTTAPSSNPLRIGLRLCIATLAAILLAPPSLPTANAQTTQSGSQPADFYIDLPTDERTALELGKLLSLSPVRVQDKTQILNTLPRPPSGTTLDVFELRFADEPLERRRQHFDSIQTTVESEIAINRTYVIIANQSLAGMPGPLKFIFRPRPGRRPPDDMGAYTRFYWDSLRVNNINQPTLFSYQPNDLPYPFILICDKARPCNTNTVSAILRPTTPVAPPTPPKTKRNEGERRQATPRRASPYETSPRRIILLDRHGRPSPTRYKVRLLADCTRLPTEETDFRNLDGRSEISLRAPEGAQTCVNLKDDDERSFCVPFSSKLRDFPIHLHTIDRFKCPDPTIHVNVKFFLTSDHQPPDPITAQELFKEDPTFRLHGQPPRAKMTLPRPALSPNIPLKVLSGLFRYDNHRPKNNRTVYIYLQPTYFRLSDLSFSPVDSLRKPFDNCQPRVDIPIRLRLDDNDSRWSNINLQYSDGRYTVPKSHASLKIRKYWDADAQRPRMFFSAGNCQLRENDSYIPQSAFLGIPWQPKVKDAGPRLVALTTRSDSTLSRVGINADLEASFWQEVYELIYRVEADHDLKHGRLYVLFSGSSSPASDSSRNFSDKLFPKIADARSAADRFLQDYSGSPNEAFDLTSGLYNQVIGLLDTPSPNIDLRGVNILLIGPQVSGGGNHSACTLLSRDAVKQDLKRLATAKARVFIVEIYDSDSHDFRRGQKGGQSPDAVAGYEHLKRCASTVSGVDAFLIGSAGLVGATRQKNFDKVLAQMTRHFGLP